MNNEQIYKEFGEKIKNLRKEKKCTQSQLANALGVTQSTIVAIEKGNRRIPLSMLESLANFFETSVDILIDHPGSKKLDPIDIETGKKLFNLRESHHLSRLDLSKQLNITVSTLANYESGISKVPVDDLIKFSSYFNVSVDELIGLNLHDTNYEPHLSLFNKLSKELGNVQLTNEEEDKIIDFTKFLITQRKK